MPTIRHLSRAPVVEALIDYRVKARPDLDVAEFLACRPSVISRFPRHHEQRRIEAQINISDAKAKAPVLEDLGVLGHVFVSEDGKTFAQFRADGFTLNKLQPYSSWDELFPLATELWKLYSTVARPVSVTRVAVRTINRIRMPVSDVHFEDFFVASPSIPPELPQHVSGFSSQLTIPDPARGVAAHIVQVLERGAEGISVILDVDAFKDGPIVDAQLPTAFATLREFKNLIFFSMVTDRCLRDFD